MDMNEMLSAFIAVALPVVGYALHRMQKRDNEQHGQILGRIDDLQDDIREVRGRVDEHIAWHHDMPSPAVSKGRK
jgi:hypothetical protein